MHFLKMIVLRGELMRFVIYVDNVQQLDALMSFLVNETNSNCVT